MSCPPALEPELLADEELDPGEELEAPAVLRLDVDDWELEAPVAVADAVPPSSPTLLVTPEEPTELETLLLVE